MFTPCKYCVSSLMSKRVRIYTIEDVAKHNSPHSCWVTRAGKVYDMTSFLEDHPGGDDLILKYAGKDVEDIMKDVIEHEHSDAAYDILEDHVIGKIGAKDMTVNNSIHFYVFILTRVLTFFFLPDWEAADDFHPEDTDTTKDFEENKFLDLRKPLLRQVWEAKFRYIPRAVIPYLSFTLASVRLITSRKCINRVIFQSLLVSLGQRFLRYEYSTWSNLYC